MDHLLKQAIDKQIAVINSKKEEFVTAWIAETGLLPSESEMIISTEHENDTIITRIYIRKRDI